MDNLHNVYGIYMILSMVFVICSIRAKHRENCKTLPWEHHISCQMCQIPLSKKTEKVKKKVSGFFLWRGCMIFLTTVTTVTAVTTVFIFFTFLVLLEREIWHIWQPMWCSLGSVLRFSLSFVERLRDFLCEEVAWFS